MRSRRSRTGRPWADTGPGHRGQPVLYRGTRGTRSGIAAPAGVPCTGRARDTMGADLAICESLASRSDRQRFPDGPTGRFAACRMSKWLL